MAAKTLANLLRCHGNKSLRHNMCWCFCDVTFDRRYRYSDFLLRLESWTMLNDVFIMVELFWEDWCLKPVEMVHDYWLRAEHLVKSWTACSSFTFLFLYSDLERESVIKYIHPLASKAWPHFLPPLFTPIFTAYLSFHPLSLSPSFPLPFFTSSLTAPRMITFAIISPSFERMKNSCKRMWWAVWLCSMFQLMT